MRTVNGMLLLVVAVFLLWIGVTGRFPALIAAIGLVKGSAPGTSTGGTKASTNLSSTTSGTSSSVGGFNVLPFPMVASH